MDSKTLTIALIVLVVLCSVLMSLKKRSTFRKLQSLLAAGNYDEFYDLLDSRMTRVLYPEYNRTYLRLNSYIIQGDDKRTEELFDELLSRGLPKAQRTDLVVKAFSFFVSKEDRKRSKELLREIEGWDDQKHAAAKRECRRMYDIVISKQSNHIEEMEAELDSASAMQRGRLEYFLALQYENKGDLEKRDEYLKLATDDAFTPSKK